jgi:acyl dehydratase
MRNIEEIRKSVGSDYPPSDWFMIDQDRVNRFGEATFDDGWNHTDPVKAAAFGGATVQGSLLISLVPYLMRDHLGMPEGCTNGVNLGYDRLRITSAVRVGKRVRLLAKLQEFAPYRETMWRQVTDVTLEIEGEDKPALRGSWIIVYM